MPDPDRVERARSVPIESVLARRGIHLRRSGVERIGPCPKCGGTDRFSVNVKDNVWNCRQCKPDTVAGDVIGLVEWWDGCDFGGALDYLDGPGGPSPRARNGYTRGNGHAEPKRPRLGPIVATFDYTDLNGDLLFQVTKHDPKDFRQRRPDGHGGWISGTQGVPMVPYRLPELQEAIAADRTIFIVEGEKDVDNAIALSVPATCNPRGAGKWASCQIDKYFEGAHVVIVADNDPQSTNKKTGEPLTHPDGRPRFAGWDHACDIARHLEAVAASIRIVDLKHFWRACPEKGDLSDWIAAGGTIEALYDIAERAPEWARDVEREKAETHIPLPLVPSSQWQGLPVLLTRWLVWERIPMRQVALLSGAGASGKTTIALQLAVAVAAGLNDWLGGIINEPGPVIFYTAEEEEADIQQRLNSVVTHYGIDLPKNLFVHCVNDEDSVAGDSCLLGMADRRGVMQPTDIYWRLRKSIEEVRPKLIIIESASDVFGGDEINRQQVRAFVRMLKAIAMHYDCVILLLSHPSAAGLRDGSGISGSTQWRNGPRCHMFFKTVKAKESGADDEEEEDATDHRELEIKKLNQGRQGERIKLLWKNGVFVHEPKDSPLQRVANDAAVDDLFLKLLHRYQSSGRNVCEKASSTFAPAQFAKEAESKAGHITKYDFDQSMRRLMARGRVSVLVEGPASKRRGRLVDTTTMPHQFSTEESRKDEYQKTLL